MAFPSIDIGANPLDSLSPTFAQSAPPATPGGMFGGGGASWQNALLAALAGFMARRNPSVSNNLINGLQQAQALKQQALAAAQQRQQSIQDKRDEFTFEQDYKNAHDTPDLQQRIDVLNQVDPALGPQYARNYAANGGGSMIQVVDPATGQKYIMPQPQLPAIGSVMDDPRKTGGPTPQASAMFPRPY